MTLVLLHSTIKFTSPLVFSGETYFISDCFELEFERKNRQSTVLVFTDEMDNFEKKRKKKECYVLLALY